MLGHDHQDMHGVQEMLRKFDEEENPPVSHEGADDGADSDGSAQEVTQDDVAVAFPAVVATLVDLCPTPCMGLRCMCLDLHFISIVARWCAVPSH